MQEETARSAIDTFICAFNASDDRYVNEGIGAVERFVLDIRRHAAGSGTMVRCSPVVCSNSPSRVRSSTRRPAENELSPPSSSDIRLACTSG
jgi:hypothetical protein